MHGPIGFQQYWLRTQGYGGKNLLQLIADKCFNTDLDICAITSDEDEIPRGSIHDRFGWLKENCTKDLERKGYEIDTLGENVLIVASNEKRVDLVNGQTVRARYRERQVDHLVIGSNRVPIGEDFKETLKWIRGETNTISAVRYPEAQRLISVPEHGLCTGHGGIGPTLLEECATDYDAIEGHNQQLIFDGVIAKLPPFSSYARKLNYDAQKLAERLGKYWIATSDAHRIGSAGRSYIWFNHDLLDRSSGDGFVESLRNVIILNQFDKHCEYEPFARWANWVSKFMWGCKFGKGV